eukprot:677248-Prorocentrum_minimum.AAC.4
MNHLQSLRIATLLQHCNSKYTGTLCTNVVHAVLARLPIGTRNANTSASSPSSSPPPYEFEKRYCLKATGSVHSLAYSFSKLRSLCTSGTDAQTLAVSLSKPSAAVNCAQLATHCAPLADVAARSGVKTTVTFDSGHTLHTDVPSKDGGGDTAPQPVEHLLTALVGCEQATAAFVARRMKPRLRLESITFNYEAVSFSQSNPSKTSCESTKGRHGHASSAKIAGENPNSSVGVRENLGGEYQSWILQCETA